NPLGNTLGLAAGAVGSLTQGLADGGLLAPVEGLLGALPDGGNAVLQPGLGTTGGAVDNLVPLGLNGPLASVGATLDPVVSPVTDAAGGLTQSLGNTTGLGQPVAGVLDSLGDTLGQAGAQTGAAGLTGVGGLLAGLGDTLGATGGLVSGEGAN